MSRQRKRMYLIAAALILLAAGAVFYAEVYHSGEKAPGGVFICL